MAGRSTGRLALRGPVAAGLAADAVVHLRLAAGYQLAAPGGIGEGTLFRIQAGTAIVAALLVLVRGSRPTAVFAFLVAIAALGAVLLYRYVDVPALGPLPSMYEPVWFPEKTFSAVAEAVAALAALGLYLVPRTTGRPAAVMTGSSA
ncbi:MAG: hypothetical protein ACXVX8_12770 [Blastococcus sp.]